MNFLRKYSAFLIPAAVVVVAVIFFVPTILIGRSVKKDMEESISSGNQIKSLVRKTLSKNQYKEEKQRVAEKVIDLLEQRFPGISSDVEMIDVATPLTFEQYTSNWKGSIIGWDVTTETAFKLIPKALPGLQNFWMAGQWVEPGGGVPMVALSGRNVIQLIAKKDRKSFAVHST